MRRVRVVLLLLARVGLLRLVRVQYGVYFGAGQHAFLGAKPATSIAAAPAEMTPAIPGGEEAPPAPEVRETSAIGAPSGGLLLPTPSGN